MIVLGSQLILQNPIQFILFPAKTPLNIIQFNTIHTTMNHTATRNKALNGLKQAEAKIQEAIKQQNRGKSISNEVQQALKTFFPKQDTSFLPILLKRIQLIKKNVIPHVKIKEFNWNMIAHTNIGAFHEGALITKTPAAALPKKKYIAIYNPFWNNHKPYQPGVLIHEAFHYYFDFIRNHSETKRRTNAFAYQGFVSTLGGLPIGKALKKNLGLITTNYPSHSNPSSSLASLTKHEPTKLTKRPIG